MFANDRADGVRYAQKKRAYRADRDGRGDDRSLDEFNASLQTVSVRQEVILAAGAFNTPQLLMLSGIGPEPHLRETKITPIVPRDGVGSNLQDRYEIPVIDNVGAEFKLLHDYAFTDDAQDRGLGLWQEDPRRGFYTTNRGTLGIMRRSQGGAGDCDLLIFGLPGEFGGYKLGYSKCIRTPEGRSRFSWVILKAHTQNSRTVRLRSGDPRDPPQIVTKSFCDGEDRGDPDLDALVWAVGEVRRWMEPVRNGGISKGETLPGPNEQNLRRFIMTHTWGHHASCTFAIGDVLDKDFRASALPATICGSSMPRCFRKFPAISTCCRST